MLRKPTKFYTTEDIKYDIGIKAVVELASHNSLEKVSWKGLGKNIYGLCTNAKSTGNIQIEHEILYNGENNFSQI